MRNMFNYFKSEWDLNDSATCLKHIINFIEHFSLTFLFFKKSNLLVNKRIDTISKQIKYSEAI